jgi:ubiquinone/menaquinone biosynthesis C-methylase UbiE
VGSTKSKIQAYWDARPCGSSESTNSEGLVEFFQNHARTRYQREPEIQSFACFGKWKGRQVLETGVGMGADYIRFAQAGAGAVGIDLSFHSIELARQNAKINRVNPLLLNADVESLPFADCSFDLVYSWGVLHHTPDTQRALREVHRVLKPGGECRAMLYHRRSLVALQCYLLYGLAGFRPFTSLSDLIGAHIESPGTKAISTAEAKFLFREFRKVGIKRAVTVYDLRLSRRWFAPRWMLRLVPAGLGWFLLIRAQK